MNNKEIQRQRMYSYFITACQDLIKEEGMDQLTIRKISDKAGYNSATLYNYFENLDQLKALSLLDNIKPYFYSIRSLYNMDLNLIDRFLLIWREYAKYSFRNPQVYTEVFESSNSDNILSYIDKYFEYFPSDEFSKEDDVYNLVYNRDMKQRDKVLLDPEVGAGYISEKQAKYLISGIYALHIGMCNQVLNGYYDDSDQALNLFMNYLIDMFLLNSNVDENKAELLNRVSSLKLNENM
ncbi:TetR/AcrR family transcriptional regulator [Companilactobacillus baiquanensis]|uniref:TetR/AcrR family transcriptional regulator n=1 Tax=Companilactobacillus baiquanensis TaxID=2486005 RepID=A0ABW1UUR2_9LACO|nr:TetR/AcrR family transcriptional regulator [Companilactobacillus baiquanensis]